MNDHSRKADHDDELEVRELLNAVVISFTNVGQLDSHCLVEIFADIRDVTSRTAQSVVVLNLRLIKLVNSEALSQLVSLSRELKAAERSLRLCHVQPVNIEVLKITGLIRLLDVFPDVSAATAP
jgi:anti-anti-sigma factor